MAAAGLDVAQLSTYCSLPQQSINTLLNAPTTELVRSLLENIAAKAREHDKLASENLKLRVELENAVRGGESKNRILKGSIDKGLKEAAELRQKLQAEETARASVETELENLKTSTSESSSELASQRTRISALESSNRDTLSLLESKATAYDRLAEELNTQHQRTLELRREVSTLEQSVQSANAASTSVRFHEQGLQQEIESLKRSNDWLDKELKTKSAEYTKYRKEKGLRIAELQRQYEDAQSTIDAANRTETNLRRRMDEISQKADESLTRAQQMQEEIAKKDESYTIELEAANRLTELTRNSANTERQRRQDLSAELENAKEDASEQLGKLGAELETEHRDREAADAKIGELEVQVEQLQANISALQSRPLPLSSSHQGLNGHATPTRGVASTPMGSPGTPRPKGGLSITQMYSSYNDLKSELDFEKRRNEKLTSTLDDMIQDLESRQPEVEELRSDHARLESEIAEMSSLVDVIGKERDQALKGAKRWEGQVEAKAREGELLRQQLRDLSSQVKVFLMEVHLHNHGQDNLSAEARAQLERLAQGHADGEAQEDMTDTDRFISQNLVTFRNIGELQEQNTNLLRITRELGEKMEHEESVRRQLEETRDWDDLQEKYERCKDEVKSLVTQSQSYIRERDMFRRMLAHRGQLPPTTDASAPFDAPVDGDAAPATPRNGEVMNSIENSPSAKDLADYATLYRDMQDHFDAYRNEAATDRSTLKEQVDSLSRLNGELRSEVVRGNSQVTLAHERYEMLQANYAMLRNENMEHQKRSQSLSESAAKQELRVQQVAEDLIEAKGLIDSMRNENANLKAEKDFWKSIEKRMTEDNENLLNERSRLNTLNANLQNLLNEREHSDNEARRRLQMQADSLEKELQSTKAKLSEETEENKRLTQRREYDNEQSQKRIDDLVSSLGAIREQLVAANTTKDHLSARVDDLTIELRSAEERANALQPTTAPRPDAANSDLSHDTFANGDESSLSKEQELVVQTSELKRDLALTTAELENVKSQVEQYKAISQASEEELQSLNETQDLYRQETDKLVEERNAKIKELEQRVEDTTLELASTNSELSELRNERAESWRRLDDQKKVYEAEIAQLKDQDDRHAAAAQFYQEDLKTQAGIAQQAQHNYETELVKHADAAKALQKVRADYNELKLEVVEVKMEAESARTSLSQSEESWLESRDRYDRELAELKAGRENLTTQNNRLHQQLETVTAQISSLNKRTSSDGETANEDSPTAGLENLQEVIKYLRREKEIVDVQLELSAQEGKRLKQQLDYTQSQLDDTRLRLNQQRRVEADNERSRFDHNKLLETINELNTFRESSVTLRAESRQAQAALAAKTTEVESLVAQIEPLQAAIQELKDQRETQAEEMKLLRENSDRWQQRAQNVLQKYDRVDPAELEALKEQLSKLETERDELVSSKQDLQEQADSASSQVAQAQEQAEARLETLKARLTEQFKSRSKILSDKIKEKDAALQTASTEKQGLEQQLVGMSGLQTELDTTRAERDSAVEKAGNQTTGNDANDRNGSEDGQVDEDEAQRRTQANVQELQDKLAASEARAGEEASQSAKFRSELDACRSRIAELELQVKQMQESIDAYKAELAQLRDTQQQVSNMPNEEVEQQLVELRKDLALAQQDTENLRAMAAVNTALANAPVEDGSRSLADQVAENVEAVRAELEVRHNERVKEAEENMEKRANGMRTQLTNKLKEGKATIRQSLAAEHEQALQALKAEHEQQMETLQTRHKDELDELKRNEDSRIAKLREAWDKEHEAPQGIDDSPDVKTGREAPYSPWEPSEAEARAFVQSNAVVRSIVKNNITAHVKKETDQQVARLKEEHEKAMVEFQAKAITAKEHAVMMEGKKTALQVNMANNKAKISQFKIGIVEKAAQETPEKPVQEVWLVAKDAKPPPTAPPAQQASSKAQQTSATGPGQPTSSAPAQSTTAHKTPPAAIVGQPTSSASNAPTPHQPPVQTNQQSRQPSIPTFGRPTPAAAPTQAPPLAQQSPPRPSPNQNRSSSSVGNSNQPPSSSQGPPSQPRKLLQETVNHQPNAGTGPAALRGLQQSGLPVARGGSVRGNANPRGRGGGRGGPQGINTNQAQHQERNSPTSGGMNPGAKQFVPGNKRPRDDEQQGGDAGNGKRIRGGGGGRGGS